MNINEKRGKYTITTFTVQTNTFSISLDEHSNSEKKVSPFGGGSGGNAPRSKNINALLKMHFFKQLLLK